MIFHEDARDLCVRGLRAGGRQMWVPIIVWAILMLHGVSRSLAIAAGLETASRFKRRKDFPGASGAQTAPDSLAYIIS